MPERTDEELDYAERMSQNAQAYKDAWEATIEEMKAMAAELEADGWDATYVGAGHTAPESPRVEPEGRFGLTYVIPNNYEDDFVGAFRPGGYDEYEVFRNEVAGTVFQVTALYDTETKRAILLAGNYELMHANPLILTSMRQGETYTHVQLLDGTHLGSFRHEAWEPFFPDAEQRIQHVTEEMEKAALGEDEEFDHWAVAQMAGDEPPMQNARLDDVDPDEVEDETLPEELEADADAESTEK
jgi:hypothetical protein